MAEWYALATASKALRRRGFGAVKRYMIAWYTQNGVIAN